MRIGMTSLLLLATACGGATKPQDSAVVTDANALADGGRLDGVASTDLDSCWNVSACEQFTHPGKCPAVDYRTTGLDFALDAGSCESRATVACDSDAGAGWVLDRRLSDILDACGVFMLERTVVVTFAGGCANHLSFSTPPPPDWNDTATPCFIRELQASHFACADQVPCWTMSYSTLF